MRLNFWAVVFAVLVAASHAALVGSSNAAYSKNSVVLRSTGNDYFNMNLRYDLTLQVETPSQYVVYVGTNTVCPGAPLTITASVSKPRYSVNSCEVSLDDVLASTGGSNSETAVSSFSSSDISSLNSEYFGGAPSAFDGGTDKETPAGYRPYPPVTDSLSTSRTCRVEYSFNQFRNSQRVNTYVALVPQASFSYRGSSLGSRTLSGTGSGTSASVSATATSSGSISITSSPQNLYLVAYMPADPAIIGESGWYSYNIFTERALQGSFGSTSASLSLRVENRNPSIAIEGISPTTLSQIPQTFTLTVRNTGNIPVSVSSVSASNGYEAVLLDSPTINPGSAANVRVNVAKAGSGSFTISLTATPSASVDCNGNALATVSATSSEIEGPQFDTYPSFDEETQVPVGDDPVELNYVVDINFVNSGANNVPVHMEVTDRETGETLTVDQLVSSASPGAEKIALPTMVCEPDKMKIYDINISVDPENLIDETDESNNNLTTTVFCLAPLACSPDPAGVLIMPGFSSTASFYCGLGPEGTLSACDYGRIELPVDEDDEFLRYVEDGLSARISDRTPTLQLEFFPTPSASTLEETKEYSLNVIIPNQDKTFQDIDGDPVQVDSLTYTCQVDVAYFGGECSYYI